MTNTKDIVLKIGDKDVLLTLSAETSNEETIFEVTDAFENAEAPIQIKEGCFYEYKISEGFDLAPSIAVIPSKLNPSSGRISPNIYVGTLHIGILK